MDARQELFALFQQASRQILGQTVVIASWEDAQRVIQKIMNKVPVYRRSTRASVPQALEPAIELSPASARPIAVQSANLNPERLNKEAQSQAIQKVIPLHVVEEQNDTANADQASTATFR